MNKSITDLNMFDNMDLSLDSLDLLVPARGEWDGSGIGECKEGLPGDMPGMRAPGEGPETSGEPGHGPTLGLTDMDGVYGELGSRVPAIQMKDIWTTTHYLQECQFPSMYSFLSMT